MPHILPHREWSIDALPTRVIVNYGRLKQSPERPSIAHHRKRVEREQARRAERWGNASTCAPGKA